MWSLSNLSKHFITTGVSVTGLLSSRDVTVDFLGTGIMADLLKQDESIAFFVRVLFFAVLMALCSVAAASPDLNAAFLCFKRVWTSYHIHGSGFPQMVMAFVTPTSSIHLYVPQKQCLCTPQHLSLMVAASSDRPVYALETVLKCRHSYLQPNPHLFVMLTPAYRPLLIRTKPSSDV